MADQAQYPPLFIDVAHRRVTSSTSSGYVPFRAWPKLVQAQRPLCRPRSSFISPLIAALDPATHTAGKFPQPAAAIGDFWHRSADCEASSTTTVRATRPSMGAHTNIVSRLGRMGR
jgi:hypothetical protein